VNRAEARRLLTISHREPVDNQFSGYFWPDLLGGVDQVDKAVEVDS
jgi:hypothetical protein